MSTYFPAIRFPEFTSSWVKAKLREYLKQSKGKNRDLTFNKQDVLSVAAEAGVVNQIEYHGRSYAGVSVAPYGVLKKGEIVYTKSPLKEYPYGIIKVNDYKDGIVSTLYAIYSIKGRCSGKFLDYYFYHNDRINRYLKPLVNKGAKNDMKVNNDEVLNNYVIFPSLPEQQKIADFLSAVDKKIELLTRKKELLEQYKRGVMQKLFSQEIRFKDEQGRSFPEWERVRLGDVANIVGGGTPDTSEESYWNGEINWFTPTEIKGKYLTKSKRTISQKGLKNSSAKLLPTGTILFTSRATIGDVGFAMIECSTNQGFQSLVVNPEYSSEFIYQLVLYKKKEFLRKAQGSTFIEISSKTMKKMRFNIPVLQEQDKIADFLSSIDKKIELVQNQIKTTQTFKKGLLQQMFV